MKKPKPKNRPSLDFSECTAYIEKKYKCDTRDYARSNTQFGEWCEAKGEAVVDSLKDVEGAQKQYARYTAAVASGDVIERPYQDFWHFLYHAINPKRGATIELYEGLDEGAEPWQKEILGLYLKEFGPGPYLTDW